MRVVAAISLAFLLGAWTWGAQADFVAVAQPPPADDPPPPLVLGPGDQIDIEVPGLEGTLQTCTVGLDGMVYYGPTDGVDANGLTLGQTVDAITAQMGVFLRHPRLSVNLRQIVSQKATVLGRVNTPGIITLKGGERIIDLLSATGFLATSQLGGSSEELADLTGALYVRHGQALAIDFTALIRHGDLRYNIRVHPGDYCYIPSSVSREVFVLGAVVRPKPIGYEDGLTLARAVAAASGLTKDAWPDRCIVIRGSTAAPTAARVDLEAIYEGRAADMPLLPHDYVYVPGASSADPGKLVRLGVDTFVGTLSGIYAQKVYRQVVKP